MAQGSLLANWHEARPARSFQPLSARSPGLSQWGRPSLRGRVSHLAMLLAKTEKGRGSLNFTKARVVSGGVWSDSSLPWFYIPESVLRHNQLTCWALSEVALESLKAWNINMESNNAFLARSGTFKIVCPAWLSLEHGPVCCEVICQYLCPSKYVINDISLFRILQGVWISVIAG